jgi:hypothetical protein
MRKTIKYFGCKTSVKIELNCETIQEKERKCDATLRDLE